MKTRFLFIISLSLLLSNNLSSKDAPVSNNSSRQDSITVVSSPDLLNLTNQWISAYSRLNPDVKINALTIPENGGIDLNAIPGLGFVSAEYYPSFQKVSAWREVIGRDVFVPVMNSRNPFLAEINSQGISSEEMALAFSGPSAMNWASLVENAENVPLNYYVISGESVKSGIARFLGVEQVAVQGTEVENGAGMVSAIRKDPYAIGFCRLTDILDPANNQVVENIRLVPIDRNGNGKMDYNESIYQDMNVFTRGIWIGKYPKSLYSNIYTVATVKPTNVNEIDFVKWVLTEGQQFITPNGFSELVSAERQSKVEHLLAANTEITSPQPERGILMVVLIILGTLVLAGFLLDALMRFLRHRRAEAPFTGSVFQRVFNENSLTLLNGLYYDKSHTWAYMEKDGMVKIGIDDFLQHVTGTITQVKMKNTGERIKKGEPVLSVIHKGKQLNIKAPVSGIIRENNSGLNVDSSLLNSSPYNEGWIYRIEPTNWVLEIQLMLIGDKYRTWVKSEFSRLKDFLSTFVKPGTMQYAHVILQDGGELSDKLLADLGPEVWEEFQVNFIDNSK